MTNSREKGKRVERSLVKRFRNEGYTARRGQQYAGGPESPDILIDELTFLHTECKGGKRIAILDAIDQAKRDCGDKMPVVAFKYDYCDWNFAMPAEVFFELIREYKA